jgi:hypothetical protein
MDPYPADSLRPVCPDRALESPGRWIPLRQVPATDNATEGRGWGWAMTDVEITVATLVKHKGPMDAAELSLVQQWLNADWESHDVLDPDVRALIYRLIATAKALLDRG